MTDNARFEPIPGAAQFEVIGIETIAHYDPITDSGTVVTNAAKYLVVDGQYRGDVPPARCGSVVTDVATHAQDIVGLPGMVDPVTGADLSGVSVLGMMALHKVWFDRRWNTPPDVAPEPELPPGEE
ncbi:MAG TPA: hypothetical protein VIG97_07410 [Luteimonas sp.]